MAEKKEGNWIPDDGTEDWLLYSDPDRNMNDKLLPCLRHTFLISINSRQQSFLGASLVSQMVKNLPPMRETWAWPLSLEDILEKGMTILSSIILPRKSQGQRSFVGYSLWGHKELDMTKWLILSVTPKWYIIYFTFWCIKFYLNM